eukprot:TRINITY_DN1681_c0_g1_i2.p1 TRINITY_DN1681_c0_g1~~TRINITY_DN1681_c0_g1_i2.p1  ORF type:complete len:534 (+),score=163.16 TRINITY_DN1681_c0_g1_i2:45-1646(+)
MNFFRRASSSSKPEADKERASRRSSLKSEDGTPLPSPMMTPKEQKKQEDARMKKEKKERKVKRGTTIRVKVVQNGKQSSMYMTIQPHKTTFEELLGKISTTLKMKATRLFDEQGTEFTDVESLRENDFIVVSEGEDYIPRAMSPIARQESGVAFNFSPPSSPSISAPASPVAPTSPTTGLPKSPSTEKPTLLISSPSSDKPFLRASPSSEKASTLPPPSLKVSPSSEYKQRANTLQLPSFSATPKMSQVNRVLTNRMLIRGESVLRVLPRTPKPKIDEEELVAKRMKEASDHKWSINFEDLEFEEVVSEGSTGEVWLGFYFGTPVAIKKLTQVDEAEKYKIEREYNILKDINHPNIVQFLGICDHKYIHLVTEYIEHGDLFDLVNFGEGKTLDWSIKTRIILQIAQSVYYLHCKNVIHRDLKSQNILLGDNYKVKLCDLGLATVLDAKQVKRLTQCGTNEWLAPEIAFADNYDSKVDVFSFAIVMTELICCAPPAKRTLEDQFKFDEQGFLDSAPQGCPKELLDGHRLYQVGS